MTAEQFAPELASMDPAHSASVPACVQIPTHFETLERLHQAKGLSSEEVRDTVSEGLHTLLAPPAES